MELIRTIETIVQPLLDELMLELVDVEYRRESHGWVLRFFLDKDGGITLDDCAGASRQISSLLDVEDIIPTTYTLEVSSPGLERPLKKAADFKRFIGKIAKIKTIDALDLENSGKRKKTYIGKLVGLERNDTVVLLLDQSAVEARISLSNIDMAHLVLDF